MIKCKDSGGEGDKQNEAKINDSSCAISDIAIEGKIRNELSESETETIIVGNWTVCMVWLVQNYNQMINTENVMTLLIFVKCLISNVLI